MKPGICTCDLIWGKGLCRCDLVQDLEIRSSRIIQVDPKYHPYKREAEKPLSHTEKAVSTRAEIGTKQLQGIECQGIPAAARSQERPGQILHGASRGSTALSTPWFLTLGLRNGENTFLLF